MTVKHSGTIVEYPNGQAAGQVELTGRDADDNAVPWGTDTYPASVKIVGGGGGGGGAVTVADGADVAQGAKGDTPVTNPALSASEIALLKGLLSVLSGTLTVGGTVEVANDVGNPLPVSGTVAVTGVATAANQATGNTSLANVDTKTPALVGGNSPVVIAAALPAGTNTIGTTATPSGVFSDASGTLTTGGTAQQVMAANSARKKLVFQNNSTAALWINFGVTAVQSQPSLQIAANGGSYESDAAFVPTGLVSVIGATTSQAFSAKEA